eukprot:6074935-Prorocentrum_lima.AAC.1
MASSSPCRPQATSTVAADQLGPASKILLLSTWQTQLHSGRSEGGPPMATSKAYILKSAILICFC